MVIVVTAPTRVEASSLANALADHLNWPWVDAYRHHSAAHAEAHPEQGSNNGAPGRPDVPKTLREWIAEAGGRREALILTAKPLSYADYVELTDGVRHVRVVGLAPAGRDARDTTPVATDHAGSQVRDNAAHSSDSFMHLSLDSAGDIDALVGHVRLAFGV